jgi:hypothetical protein
MYLECSSGVCGKNNRGPLEKKPKAAATTILFPNLVVKSTGK